MKFILRLSFLLLVSIVVTQTGLSQDKSKRASPPAEATGAIGEATVTVNYSSPAIKGRTLWGELVPYGKIWRAGANEATTFETNKDIMVEGQKLAAGKYALFAIPGETEWVFVFNSVPDQWGAYSYDESKDVLRVTVKPVMGDESVERLSYMVDTESGMVKLMWGKLTAGFAVK